MESSTSSQETTEDELAGSRLLVVDDEEINRDLLMRRLERRGFQVVAAQDGQEALQALNKEKFDLILLDVMRVPKGRVTRLCVKDSMMRFFAYPRTFLVGNVKRLCTCVLRAKWNTTRMRAVIKTFLHRKWVTSSLTK